MPAGPGGTITLTFRPAATYHLALVISILAALILLAVAAWSFLRRPPAGHNAVAAPGSRSAEPMVVTLYPFLPVQSGSHWSAPRRPGRHAWLGVLAVTALIFVVSGPMALVVPVLAALAWLPWRQRAGQPGRTALEPLPLIALAAMVASGVLSAASPSGQGLLGPFGWPAQACALVALAAALIPAATLPPRPGPRTSPAARSGPRTSPAARGGRMSAGPYAGIALALLAATAYNVGLIQEKRALGRMPALDVRRVPRLVTGLLADPAWLAGFALMLVGLACQIVVLSFEPVSVVQPVLASGVALVLVLSRVVLRERLGAVELWCVAALAACVILLAASAGGTSAAAGHHASPGWMTAVAVPSAVIGLLVAASPLRTRAGGHRAQPGGHRAGPAATVPGRRSASAWAPGCCTASRRWPSRRCRGSWSGTTAPRTSRPAWPARPTCTCWGAARPRPWCCTRSGCSPAGPPSSSPPPPSPAACIS